MVWMHYEKARILFRWFSVFEDEGGMVIILNECPWDIDKGAHSTYYYVCLCVPFVCAQFNDDVKIYFYKICSIRSFPFNISHNPYIYLLLWTNLCGSVCFWYMKFKLSILWFICRLCFTHAIYFHFDVCRICAFWFYFVILPFGPNDRHSIFISIHSSTDFVILYYFICHLLSSKSISCCFLFHFSALFYSIHSIIDCIQFPSIQTVCSQWCWCNWLHWTNVSAFISCISYVFIRLEGTLCHTMPPHSILVVLPLFSFINFHFISVRQSMLFFCECKCNIAHLDKQKRQRAFADIYLYV